VVTGQVLDDGLPRIERGANKVSIPKFYWKVVLDKEQQKAIGFVLPNPPGTKPLELYAVAIDSVERFTGLSFFTAQSAGEKALLAKQKITKDWFHQVASGDVELVPIQELKRGQISTMMAPSAMGSSRNVILVGKVVSGRVSRAGNVLLNLDKQYPNETFSVFIKKEDLVNFGYDPVAFLKGKRIAVTGRVSDFGGKPTMYIGNGKEVEVLVEWQWEQICKTINLKKMKLYYDVELITRQPFADGEDFSMYCGYTDKNEALTVALAIGKFYPYHKYLTKILVNEYDLAGKNLLN
jgi:endonuclease G